MSGGLPRDNPASTLGWSKLMIKTPSEQRYLIQIVNAQNYMFSKMYIELSGKIM
jgi:hypothetical protein